MAKIVRVNGDVKAFASAAIGTERTLFGEVTQANDLTSQFTADFLRGWGIVGPSDQPTLEDFNGAMYTNGQLSAYLHQIGIAEYNALQEYHIGSLCNVAGVVYSSLINTNVGNTPTSSPTQWRELYAAATETLRGSVELATAAETVAGASSSLVTHPAGVAAAIAAAQKLPKGYFFGFTMANNSGAPNTTVDVGAGSASDSTGAVDINLTSTFSGILQASGAWAAGSGQNKLDTGARANSTWYHVYSIRKTSDATGDILFSLSPTAPTVPTGYSGFRRIGSVQTDGSGNIIQFINVGRLFLRKTPANDAAGSLPINTDSSITLTLSVPLGVRVASIFHAAFTGNTTTFYARPTDAASISIKYIAANSAAALTAWGAGMTISTATIDFAAFPFEVLSSTSSTVILQYSQADLAGFYAVTTLGYKELS